ncbi:MAG: hypothetical protein SGI72_07180 [Planctomycetota bacterium]|nr:hypothetical protein [Planctomycetota bacterium]
MSPHRRNIALFVLLLVCLRGALVLSLADVFGYGEEFAKSGAAKAMLDGLGLPHHQINYAYHEGGGFAVSHLEALGFLVLGPCVLVVKLVAIGFAIATLLAGAWMLAEHVSTRSAYIFAALFAFAPETFQRVSLLSLGTHVEASLFILLVFHFTARTVRGGGASKHAPFWMGICGGLGCYVGLQMPPVLFVCGIAILATIRGKVLVGVVGRSLAGFAIGALPLWWMMSHVGFGGVLIYRDTQKGPGFFESLPVVFTSILQSRDPLTWMQTVAFVVVIARGLVIRRAHLQWILLGYLLVFMIGWGMSGLAKPYDAAWAGAWFEMLRLVPPWLVVTALAAIGIDTLWSQGGSKRVVALVTTLIAISAGIRGTIALASGGRPGAPIENASILLSARGYSYQEYFVQLEYHFEGSRARKAAVLLRSRDDPALLVPDVANVLYGQPGYKPAPDTTPRSIENILPELAEVFGAHRDLALLGVGATVNGFWNYDVAAAFAKLETLPLDVREPLAEGLGRNGIGSRFWAEKLPLLFAVVPPERWHDAWWRGVGWRVHRTFRLRPDLARETLATLTERDRAPAIVGYERAVGLDRIR